MASAGVRNSLPSIVRGYLSQPRFSPPSKMYLPGLTCTNSDFASKRVLVQPTTLAGQGYTYAIHQTGLVHANLVIHRYPTASVYRSFDQDFKDHLSSLDAEE